MDPSLPVGAAEKVELDQPFAQQQDSILEGETPAPEVPQLVPQRGVGKVSLVESLDPSAQTLDDDAAVRHTPQNEHPTDVGASGTSANDEADSGSSSEDELPPDEDQQGADDIDQDDPQQVVGDNRDETTEIVEVGEDDAADAVEASRGQPVPFAISRVRKLIKFHAERTRIVSADAVLMIGRAVQRLLEDLSRESAAFASRGGKRTVTYEHVAAAIRKFDRFHFAADDIAIAPSPQQALFRREKS